MASETRKKSLVHHNLWIIAIYDFFSTATMRKTFYWTIGAGMYFYFVDYMVDYFYEFNAHVPSFVHYLMGYVLIVLFYFRTSSCYYKWWDARKAISYMSSNCKNFSIKTHSYLSMGDEENREFFGKMLVNFTYSLKGYLRDSVNEEELYDIHEGFTSELVSSYNPPLHCITLMNQRLDDLNKEGILSRFQKYELVQLLDSMSEHANVCISIHTTAAPFIYRFHTKMFILVYIFILPFGMVDTYPYWILFLLMGLVYFCVGCDVISDEIDEPFGKDKSDIQMESLMYSLKKSIMSMLRINLSHS